MAGCSGITGAGARCRAIAISGSDYCHAHHPDRAKTRSRAARKGGLRGGRGRPVVQLASIKEKLEDLADDVLAGSVDRSDAAVVSQIYNVVLRAISTSLKAREQEELEARIEELEDLLAQKEEAKNWG
jgi:hypothetical protein